MRDREGERQRRGKTERERGDEWEKQGDGSVG